MKNNDLKQEIIRRMTGVGKIADYFRDKIPGINGQRENWITVKSPLREDDTTPSFGLNLSSGAWKDHGTGKTGDMFTLDMSLRGGTFTDCLQRFASFLSIPATTPAKIGEGLREKHMNQEGINRFDNRGIKTETLLKHRVGYENGDAIFHYYSDGKLVSVKHHDLTKTKKSKCFFEKGSKTEFLFNGDRLKETVEDDLIYITEGEIDALTLLQNDFMAVSGCTGASNWRDQWTPLFAERRVVIVYDTDETGRNGSAKVAKALLSVVKTLQVVKLPLDGQGKDINDFFLMKTKADFDAVVDATPIQRGEVVQHHEIEITSGEGSLGKMIDAAEKAIIEKDPYALFQRNGFICRIRKEGIHNVKSAIRPIMEPIIEIPERAAVKEILDRSATFVQYNKTKEKIVPTKVPTDVVDGFLARGEWRLPVLVGISEVPIFRPDGSIHEREGYDKQTGLFYLPTDGFTWRSIPHTIDDVDLTKANYILTDLLHDFPFRQQHHRAAALSAIITPVLRFAFQGCVPLHLISSTTPASGKSLLTDLVSLIVSGREMPRYCQSKDENEERKRLTALVISGSRLCSIDNITSALGSGALDAFITSTTWADRILGQNREFKGPNYLCLYATGNNVGVVGDLCRRVIFVDLSPEVERPEERHGFRHEDLRCYVRQNRAEIVRAILLIARAFHNAGRPKAGMLPLGGFEGWSDLVRAMIIWTGLPDPCEGRKEIVDADQSLVAFKRVLIAWDELFGNEPKTLREVKKICGDSDDASQNLNEALSELAPDRSGTWTAQKVGFAFRKRRGRILDGFRIIQGSEKSRNMTSWMVERC